MRMELVMIDMTACDLTEDVAPYRVGCKKRICVSNLKSSWDISSCGVFKLCL